MHIQKVSSNSCAMLIQSNISLHDKNWFGTGGAARFYAEPVTAHEFQEAVAFAHEHNLSIFVVGEGANILVSDEGFDGLVIRPQLKALTLDTAQVQVIAQAGVSMHDLIEFCLEHNLVGLHEFSGIPGTVGGSVYINLHYFEFLLSQFIVAATVICKKTGELQTVTPEWFNFGYNDSKLLAEEYYLISATFQLLQATDLEVAYARGRRDEMIRYRSKRYPTAGTCGSFFRNFHDHEVTIESNGKKMIYVAYYLDKIGVKGELAVGGAKVSYQHANMLVASESATTNDIIELARVMQAKVYDAFGVIPHPECRLVGFKNYPLLNKE